MSEKELRDLRKARDIERNTVRHYIHDGCNPTEKIGLPQVKAFPQDTPIQIVCLECGKWIDLDGEQ